MKKERLLFIAPAIPGTLSQKRDRRLSAVLHALAGSFEVHLLYVQSLFTTDEARRQMEDMGVVTFSLKEACGRSSGSLENQIRSFFAAGGYAAVAFNTYFTARYYVPYLEPDGEGPAVIIDTAFSSYLANAVIAAGSEDLARRVAARKEAEIHQLKELAVYYHADVLISTSGKAHDILAADVPSATVETIGDLPADGEALAAWYQEVVRVFDRGVRTSRRRAEAGPVEIVAVPTSGPAGPLPVVTRRGSVRPAPATRQLSAKGGAASLVARYNAALRAMTGPYAILTTDRTILTDTALLRLPFCLGSRPKNGIAVPQSNFLVNSKIDETILPDFLAKHYPINFGFWQEARQATGYCLAVKREVVESIGLLDERFTTLFYALTDYFLKAYQAEYRVVFLNEAFVYYSEKVAETGDTARDLALLVEKWGTAGASFIEGLSE